jgi:hypothetical protein
MGRDKKEDQPTKYIIHIRNHLDSHWEHWFEGMTITHNDEGVTILSGDVVDQSALFGLLEKIHNLNLSLISFQKVDSE